MKTELHAYSRAVRLACTLVVWVITSIVSQAANNAFTNTAGGAWETSGNWNLGTTPTSADTVYLTNNGTYTVYVSTNTADTDPGGAGSWMTNANLYVGNTTGQSTLLIDFTNANRTLFV